MMTLDQRSQALEPIPLKKGTAGGYDEQWLQSLIDRHPAVLPIQDLEPGLADVLSICCELPTPSGFIDNLLITPTGGIVIVEAKLWRNPQARREVIGQILDYAKDLTEWRYLDLEQAVQRTLKRSDSLFHIVCGERAEPDEEAAFADQISRNLQLGRFLCLIVGDGIQESAEKLADFIQRHVGLHFTLALVELAVWRLPTGDDVLVQPRVVMKTVQIERAIVRLGAAADGTMLPGPSRPNTTVEINRPVSITREQFDEQVKAFDIDAPAKLDGVLSSLEPLGVWADIKKTMNLKWRAPDGSNVELGLIYPQDGKVWFDRVHWYADARERIDLSHRYIQDVADAIGGTVWKTPKATGWNIRVSGRPVAVTDILNNASDFERAVERYITDLASTFEDAQ